MVKCLPKFEYFNCVLKNKNINFKIRRSKVTDYAALNGCSTLLHNIATGKYIVINVEYGLQLHFKTFLNKSDRKTTTKIII